MSASIPPPAPLAPPDEQFWQKYSPHYEFPLSSIGSIAMHIGFLAIFLLFLWLLAKMTVSDKVPVPMTEMTLSGDGDGAGRAGGEGAPLEDQQDPKVDTKRQRLIPQAELPGIVLTPRKSTGGTGDGPESGKGNTGVPGTGSNDRGDATESGNRSKRWELIFRTESGRDYVAQLAAMEATLVIPIPPEWNVYKSYKNLRQERPAGVAFNRDELPNLYFVDDAADSAAKVANALGLDYSPPRFIAFFPKHIEEQLAAKERTYRGLREDQIATTKFKILMRDGKPVISVVDQEQIRR
jgi:hypothetical protein